MQHTWCDQCPLIQYLSPRDITREGYNLQNCVADLVSNDGWSWPQAWLMKALNLANVPMPNLVDSQMDCNQWRDRDGKLTTFSVSIVLETIRPTGNLVPWFRFVWFSHCIPRHAFQLWLIMRKSLKTQDQLRHWDVSLASDLSTVRCLLCEAQPDLHSHLFFECQFSEKIWISLRHLAGMDLVPPRLQDIVAFLQPMAHKRNVKSIIGRLIVAAAAYFVWIERNARLFKNVKRTVKEIWDCIMITVRLKLLTFRYKNKARVNDLLKLWKMPNNFRIYG